MVPPMRSAGDLGRRRDIKDYLAENCLIAPNTQDSGVYIRDVIVSYGTDTEA